MPEILITVRDKLPVVSGTDVYIEAERDDYTLRIDADSEWDGGKEVYFVRSDTREQAVSEVIDDVCAVPVIKNVGRFSYLIIGIRQGLIRSSRICTIPLRIKHENHGKEEDYA